VRRFRTASLPALLAVCVLIGVAPATATVIDRDVGFDPNDVPALPAIDPDIRSTTRKLTVQDGRRTLSLVVRFYDPQGWWPLWIRLDARGGPRVDHIVSTFGDECYVWPKGRRHDGVEVRGDVRSGARGGRVVCRMPARLVSPTKSIRWKVLTKYPDGDPGDTFEVDHAPSNHGFYG
jgi:hypothetical protein